MALKISRTDIKLYECDFSGYVQGDETQMRNGAPEMPQIDSFLRSIISKDGWLKDIKHMIKSWIVGDLLMESAL